MISNKTGTRIHREKKAALKIVVPSYLLSPFAYTSPFLSDVTVALDTRNMLLMAACNRCLALGLGNPINERSFRSCLDDETFCNNPPSPQLRGVLDIHARKSTLTGDARCYVFRGQERAHSTFYARSMTESSQQSPRRQALFR